jgi:methyl-accepting chemotaxis protein
MSALNNLKIGTRIIAVLLIFTAGLLGVTWIGLNGLQTYDRNVQDMKSMSMRSLYALKVNLAISDSASAARAIYHAKDAVEVKKLADELVQVVGDMEKILPLYEAVIPADRRQAFADRKAKMMDFIKYRREVARLGVSQGAAAAEAYGNSPQGNALRADLTKDLNDAVERNDSGIEAVTQRLDRFIEEETVLLLSLSALIIVLSLSAGFGISLFTITRPINKLATGMRTLADGDTGIEVYGAQRKDEIGVMAKTVQVFKDNMIARARAEADIAEQRRVAEEQRAARETRERKAIEEISALCDKVSGGDLDTRLSEADKEGFLLTISQQLNTLTGMLQQITGELAAVTGGMAGGDLTNAVRGSYRGVFGTLKDSVNAMADKLRDFAGKLSESAGTVSEAAAEISTGSQDLAQRTESQAASIEETAASMHEITTTVKQNADNAQAASQLATVARDAADKGGVVMTQVVGAMGQIEGSATKIGDIVSLIDEIAFQTNLLALNASVEAARAGEAGKGFAVVAQEVRALAQRSANASKDIKALISESNSQVREGGKLVGQAGETLTEIVGAVKKVSDIVAEIAAASREQATGLEQINTAVGSMDEMTQRNGALVEETSASAQSLSEQARQLADLVGFFKTGEARQPAATAHKALPRKAVVTPLRKPAATPVPALKQTSQAAAQADADWQEF